MNWSPKRLAAAARNKKDPLARASARAALDQIKADVRTARKFFKGYESIDLRNPGEISPRRLATMRKKLAALRPTLASNFVAVRPPKNKAARDALSKFIDRPISKDARVIPVGVGPDTRVVIKTRGKRASVRTERKLSGGQIWQEQSWFFEDFHDEDEHESLDTEEGINDAYSAMLESGELPRDGWYVLLTGSYGPVGAPNTAVAMQEHMARLFIEYQNVPGKLGEFIGVRLVGFSYDQAMAEYLPRRAALEERRKRRKALSSRLRRLRRNRK